MNAATLPRVSIDVVEEAHVDKRLRQLLWLYLLLLLFEGSLRKWVLPGLATPLLVVRDPVALLIYYYASLSRNYRVLNPYTFLAIGSTVIGFFLTLAVGHQNLAVAVFGARIMGLHFPLIFIFGQVFTRDDVIKVGRFILWLTPPIILLVGLQFYSPQSAWVNRGVGGDLEGGGFTGVMGFFRPPSIFSFTIGTTLFFDLAATYVAYFWISGRREINRFLLLAATISILLGVSLLLSRAYVFQLVITVVFMLLASLRSGKSLGNIGIVVALMPVLVIILLQFEFFSKSLEVISTRFTLAARSEGGVNDTLMNRILGGNFYAFAKEGVSLWGEGLGIGTNVGSTLVGREGAFIVGENEWERVIGERGLIFGAVALMTRLGVAIHLGIRSVSRLIGGDPLPWMLLGFGSVQVIFGQWAPPTILGFGVLIGGLGVASLNDKEPTRQHG